MNRPERTLLTAPRAWTRLCLVATLGAAGACGPANDASDGGGDEAAGSPTNAFAEAKVTAVGDRDVRGEVRLDQDDELLMVTGRIEGLQPGRHALVVHENGDCAATPDGIGGPVLSLGTELPAAAGRLGEAVAGDDGVLDFEFVDLSLTLGDGAGSVMNRSIVVHRLPPESGDAPPATPGEPVGCGTVEPMPTRTYLP